MVNKKLLLITVLGFSSVAFGSFKKAADLTDADFSELARLALNSASGASERAGLVDTHDMVRDAYNAATRGKSLTTSSAAAPAIQSSSAQVKCTDEGSVAPKPQQNVSGAAASVVLLAAGSARPHDSAAAPAPLVSSVHDKDKKERLAALNSQLAKLNNEDNWKARQELIVKGVSSGIHPTEIENWDEILEKSVQYNNGELVKFLLHHGAGMNGRDNLVPVLLKANTVAMAELVCSVDKQSAQTIAQWSAYLLMGTGSNTSIQPDLMRWYIARGAQVNSFSHEGLTPLQELAKEAVFIGDDSVPVRGACLVEEGADLSLVAGDSAGVAAGYHVPHIIKKGMEKYKDTNKQKYEILLGLRTALITAEKKKTSVASYELLEAQPYPY